MASFSCFQLRSHKYRCRKFLKSNKFESNLIHVIYFASVKLFSATYLELMYLCRKCETQQNSKQTTNCEATSLMAVRFARDTIDDSEVCS